MLFDRLAACLFSTLLVTAALYGLLYIAVWFGNSILGMSSNPVAMIRSDPKLRRISNWLFAAYILGLTALFYFISY